MPGLYLQIIQIIATVILIISILLQGGGAGLSGALGGGGETFRTRRGVERILVYITVFTAVVFVLATIASLFYAPV